MLRLAIFLVSAAAVAALYRRVGGDAYDSEDDYRDYASMYRRFFPAESQDFEEDPMSRGYEANFLESAKRESATPTSTSTPNPTFTPTPAESEESAESTESNDSDENDKFDNPLKILKYAATMMARFGQITSLLQSSIFARPSPFGEVLLKQASPVPAFVIPDYYFYNVTATEPYDEIDYAAARSSISNAVRNALNESSPEGFEEAVVPVLYNLRSGCAVNQLQRLLSTGFNQWSENGTASILEGIQIHTGRPADPWLAGILELVRHQVMSGINRTIFGEEFKEYEAAVNFMGRVISNQRSPNQTANAPRLVFRLARQMLQCTPKASFIMGFVRRMGTLRDRILYADPTVFAAGMLRSLPAAMFSPCNPGRQDPERLFQIVLSVVRHVLFPIQWSLGEHVQRLFGALLFRSDKPIFQSIEPNDAERLRKVLAVLRPGETGPMETRPAGNGANETTPTPPPASKRSHSDGYSKAWILELLRKSLSEN